MEADRRIARPQAVLFACGLNSIRSPMAMALLRWMYGKSIYVASAGVRRGELDPFAVAVLEEIGLDLSKHKPQTFEDIEEWEGLNFDLIVMAAVAFACLPIFFSGYSIARWEGAVFFGGYLAYTAYLVLDATQHDALPMFSNTMLFFVLPLVALTLVVVGVRALRTQGQQAAAPSI